MLYHMSYDITNNTIRRTIFCVVTIDVIAQNTELERRVARSIDRLWKLNFHPEIDC